MWAQSAVEVGKIITVARLHHKLTQAQFARAIGATQKWASEVEHGKETAQIGVAPWNAGKVAALKPDSVFLSGIVAAHTASTRR